MTCPVNVSLSGAIRTGTPGAGAKNPPSLRRSEVYPLVFRQYYRDPGTHGLGDQDEVIAVADEPLVFPSFAVGERSRWRAWWCDGVAR